jgi:hypothetical protein
MIAVSRRSTNVVPLHLQQIARVGRRQHVDGLLGNDRCLHGIHGGAVQLLLGDAPLEELLQCAVAHRHGRRREAIGQIGEERADGVAVQIAQLRGIRVVDQRREAVAVDAQRLSARFRAFSARIHDLCSRSNACRPSCPSLQPQSSGR